MTPFLLLLSGYLIGSIPFGFLLVRVGTGLDVRLMGSGHRSHERVANNRALDGGGNSTAGHRQGFSWSGSWLFGDDSPVWTSAAASARYGGPRLSRLSEVSRRESCRQLHRQLLCHTVPTPVLLQLSRQATRQVSVGSIVMAGSLPLAAWFIEHPLAEFVTTAIAAVFAVYRHREKIQRIRNGTEYALRLNERKICAMSGTIAIIGGGSWGTALAIVLAPAI